MNAWLYSGPETHNDHRLIITRMEVKPGKKYQQKPQVTHDHKFNKKLLVKDENI